MEKKNSKGEEYTEEWIVEDGEAREISEWDTEVKEDKGEDD